MKKAIGYIRISDKDQSNFSLDGQEKYIRDFAQKNGYEVLKVYRDEGRSAKNFDRPDWKELQKFCKDNQKEVDALIVAKYDRFSRNLKDSLNMIEMLEDKFSIRILSAMEPIMINPNSPFFFQFRTQMLMGAQVEWLIIKDRTKFGLHNAAKSGRFTSTAPFGYRNQRDDQNKPIIVIDEAKAPVIRKMFTMLLQGAPLKEIQLEAKRMGYKNRGHSAIKDTLSNPVYAGLVKVPAYNDEPEHLVKGLHQGIIDEATWWRAQDVLNPKQIRRTVMNEEVPLRSVLKCFCGRCMTAGNSKGRNRYYWYYRCDSHTKFNYSATKLHNQLESIFKELSLPAYQVDYLKETVYQQLHEQVKDKDLLIHEKKRELSGLQVKLDNVEEKFINNDLDKEAYQKWRSRYQQEISICQKYITDYSQPLDLAMKFYEESLPLLGDLVYAYKELADLHEKQAFVRAGFKSRLAYQDGLYRTDYLLPIWQPKALILKEKGLLIYEQPSENLTKSQCCAPDRT